MSHKWNLEKHPEKEIEQQEAQEVQQILTTHQSTTKQLTVHTNNYYN